MSNNANFIVAIAALSKTPEVRYSEGRTSATTILKIAGKERQGEKWFPFFHEVRVSGKEGTFAAQLEAGTPVVIRAMLYHNSWKDEENNATKSTTYIRAQSVRPLPIEQYPCEVERATSVGGDPYFIMTKGAEFNFTAEGNISRVALSNGGKMLYGTFGCSREYSSGDKLESHTSWLNFKVFGDEAAQLANLGIGKGWGVVVVNGSIQKSNSQKDGKTYCNTDITSGNGKLYFFPKQGSGGKTIDIDTLMQADPNDPFGRDEDLPF